MTNKHVISMKVAVATISLIALPFAATTVSADGDKTEEVTKETTTCTVVTQYGDTENCETEVITEKVVHESKDITHNTKDVNAGFGDIQASTLAVIFAAGAATLYTFSQLATKAYELRD